MELSQIQTFLGWCSVLNIGLLVFTSIVLACFRKSVSSIHSKMLGVSSEKTAEAYFSYLANFKTGVLIFNIVPYFALCLMK